MASGAHVCTTHVPLNRVTAENEKNAEESYRNLLLEKPSA